MARGDRAPAGVDPPNLTVLPAERPVAGVALLLHGGRERSYEPVAPWGSAILRIRPFATAIRRTDPRIAIGIVRDRYRGWNAPYAHPVADAAYAIHALEARFVDSPIVLVGHSMGGRAAVRAAGARSVSGVVALAPWLPIGEPVEQLAERDLAVLHGTRDHTTDPGASAAYAARAATVAHEVVSLHLAGTGHAMLRRAALWHRLAAAFVVAVVGGAPLAGVALGEKRVVTTPAGSP